MTPPAGDKLNAVTAEPQGVVSRSRIQVVAHRGSSETVPEHTLAAYLRAIDDGADALECDVRLTRDGHLVCVHDRRLERTSDGAGRVSTHTLRDLERLDFGAGPGYRERVPRGAGRRPARGEAPSRAGSRPGGPGALAPSGDREVPGQEIPDLAEPDASGARRILTLERLVEALVDANRPVKLLIETKHPTRYGNLVELRLLDLLRRYGLDRPAPDAALQVAVMSFSALALRRLHRMAPDIPAVLLLEFLPPGVLAGARLPFGATAVGPGIRVLRSRPSLVPRLRERGVPVYVWTVNEPADMDLVLELGVDGIITDRPSVVLHRLGR